jgi:hypothetical protein
MELTEFRSTLATTSESGVTSYIWENGRRYHGYKAGRELH